MELSKQTKGPKSPNEFGPLWRWAVAGGVLLLLVALLSFLSRNGQISGPPPTAETAPGMAPPSTEMRERLSSRLSRRQPPSEAAATAEQIVASKVSQFARSRREIVHSMARKHGVQVPEDVTKFFDAVEAGQWDELHALYTSLSERRKSDPPSHELSVLWPPILETLGVAESAHNWPAQQLLDYGDTILGPLPPGAVYIGGTDPGRFIPTLLSETGDGPRRIVLTQNALADQSYLDYIGFLHGESMGTLTKDDSERAFSEYIADAQRRLEHDRQFPNEPRQIRPGEDVQVVDGKVQVSGQIAVMAINERLLQMILQRNPDLSFALEESFPFKSTFADAAPLGAIMELRVRDEQNALTAERAAQSVDYWRAAAQQLLADPAANASDAVRKTYSKMAASQGGLFQEHQLIAQAEATFRIAVELCPSSPEAVFRYVNLLAGQGRIQDALPVAEAAARMDGNNQQQFRTLVAELNRMRTP